MGNTLLDKKKENDSHFLEFQSWLEQYPDLLQKKMHQNNKSFMTFSFMYKSKSQSLLLKIYLNRQNLNLQEYYNTLEVIKKTMDPSSHHTVLPFCQFRNFNQPGAKFVTVARQYLPYTLQQRLLSQPPLSQDEKIWIVFQMIISVYDLHVQGNLYHGNIRTSNFLLQSNNQLVLTDIASYKPLYLIEDDLSQVNIFYSSSNDKCTLAPEKLIKQSAQSKFKRNPIDLLKQYKKQKSTSLNLSSSNSFQSDNIENINLSLDKMSSNISTISTASQYTNYVKNQKVMDIFSLGMSILQVFLGGKTIMKIQNLLQFIKDNYPLEGFIDSAVEGLPHKQKIKLMLNSMLQKDPEKRPSIEMVLQIWKQIFDKQAYMLVWYLQSIFSKSSFIIPDLRIGLIRKLVEKIQEKQDITIKHKMQMDLSTNLQKIDFLKMMTVLIDKNIQPKIWEINSVSKSILNQIEKSIMQEPQVLRSQSIEQKSLIKQSVHSKGFSFFQMKAKDFINKDNLNPFSSMENLKIKDFNQRINRVSSEKIKKLCPPEWNAQLETLQRPKFKGMKLTEQEQIHNDFQDILQQLKNSQNIRQKYQSITHYYEYDELIKLIFSNIRTTTSVSNRLVAIELLFVVGRGSSNKTKLTKIIPYLIHLMGDSQQRVATFSLRCLIDIFYTCCDLFTSLQDTKYYHTIMQGFNVASKSSVLRLTLFQKLPQVLNIIGWLSLSQFKFTKIQTYSDQNIFIQSILKQRGSYNSNQIQLLLSNSPQLWIVPSFIPFFLSMLNIEKLLGFKSSLKIAQQAQIKKINQIDVLDMCLESGFDQSGLAIFFTIRYFRIRKIIKEETIVRLAPLILYPNRWIHQQLKQYIKMCLNNYPPTKLYFIFNRCFQIPFPIEPSQYLGLPSMFPSKMLKQKKFTDKNKTVDLFGKYFSRSKPPKDFPQNSQEIIKKWNQAAKDLIVSDVQGQQRRLSNSLGQKIVQYINLINIKNLLYYINLVNRSFTQQTAFPNIQGNSTVELTQLCQRSFGFKINNTSNVNYYQKNLLLQIQTFLVSNSQSFLKAKGINTFFYKKLFAENLIEINSIINMMDSFQIIPTLQLGKFIRDPKQVSRLNRPMGILVGQIHEHKDIISCIEKIADRFFLSGSHDGTIKLFDSRRLQDDITSDSIGMVDFKQELSDAATVKVTSMAVFDDTYTVAVATTKGTVGLYTTQISSKNSPIKTSKSKKISSNLECIKTFNAIGEIQKIITLRNQLKHSTFGIVTSQSWLALQDIRIKKQCYKCDLGKQRGMPKSFINIPGTNTLAVGTMNGYILLYDIRCNLVSNIYELDCDGQNLPILTMQNVPTLFHSEQNQQLLAISYPSKNHQLCYFNLNSSHKLIVDLQEHFISSNPQDCIISPFLNNRTKNQNFKICNNNLKQKSYYNNFIPQFYSKLDILDYLKDPLTINENTLKQKWLSQSKQKYAQITSISNKRYLPFVEYLQQGILTNLNPAIASKSHVSRLNKNKPGNNLAFLNLSANKKDNKIVNPIEKQTKKVKNTTFLPQEQALDYYTCCKIMPNFLVTGSRDSVIKIYK